MSFIEELKESLTERMNDLEPSAQEYESIKRALDALGGVERTPHIQAHLHRQRGRPTEGANSTMAREVITELSRAQEPLSRPELTQRVVNQYGRPLNSVSRKIKQMLDEDILIWQDDKIWHTLA